MRRLNYACALIDIRVDRELNDTTVVAIPSLEVNGDVLYIYITIS